MKYIFIDFDGVISTYEKQWHLDTNKLALLKEIVDKTDAKIVVTSSWKHGSGNVDEFKEKIVSRRNYDKVNETMKWFVNNIYDITDNFSFRGKEVKSYLEAHDDYVESYVILDDDCDFYENQLFNFVETDTYEGLTEREVKLCVAILNNERVVNPIRLNSTLTFKWRLKCLSLADKSEENNIEEMLKNYYNKE